MLRILLFTFLLLGAVYLILFYKSRKNISANESFGQKKDYGKETSSKVFHPEENTPYLLTVPHRPLIIAHRGGAALGPENTMQAFENAVEMGVDMLEVDVRMTADSQLITHHDATIDRMTDGRGLIADLCLAELEAYDFGHGFSEEERRTVRSSENGEKAGLTLLSDVMERFSEVSLTVEIKDEGAPGKKAVDRIIRLIERYNYRGKIIVGSFHDEVQNYVAENYSSSIPFSAARREVSKFFLLSRMRLGGLYTGLISALQLPTKYYGCDLTHPSIINAAHDMGISVHYWTVNDPEEMKRLIELNVDGIITDRPDLLIEIVE